MLQNLSSLYHTSFEIKSSDITMDDEHEVEIIGGRFVELEHVQCLSLGEVNEIVTKSPRGFDPHVKLACMMEFHTYPELEPGCAYVIAWEMFNNYPHLLALYRGCDGEYFLFDSANDWIPPPVIWHFYSHNIVPNFYSLRKDIGLQLTDTCAYQVLAFLDWVFKNRDVPTKEITDRYPYDSRKFWDVVAVETVEEMLTEFPNDIKTRDKSTPASRAWYDLVQDPVPADCIASRVKRRSKKRQKRQREEATGAEGSPAKRRKM